MKLVQYLTSLVLSFMRGDMFMLAIQFVLITCLVIKIISDITTAASDVTYISRYQIAAQP